MKRRIVPLHTIVVGRHKPVAHICHATYILEGRVPKRCLDYDFWEHWIDFPDNRCVVELTRFFHHGVVVETRFIGIDVAQAPSDGPLLFETAVDGGEMCGHRGLYKTWEDAKIGHEVVCHLVRETMT